MDKVLLIGEDVSLLQTRAAVLAQTGAEILSCIPFEVRLLPPQTAIVLVVVCHTVTGEDCNLVIETAHRNWPQAKILQLQSRLHEILSPEVDAIVEAQPSKLLQQALELMGRDEITPDGGKPSADGQASLA